MTVQNALETSTIGIVGLGYVGLPLAVEFGKRFETVGYDLNRARVLASGLLGTAVYAYPKLTSQLSGG